MGAAVPVTQYIIADPTPVDLLSLRTRTASTRSRVAPRLAIPGIRVSCMVARSSSSSSTTTMISLDRSSMIAVRAERYAGASEFKALSPLPVLIGSSASRSMSASRSSSEALRRVKSRPLALRVTGKFKVLIILVVCQYQSDNLSAHGSPGRRGERRSYAQLVRAISWAATSDGWSWPVPIRCTEAGAS